jgi:hypothetical protein
MNLLQNFMAECSRQSRPINQEEVDINGSPYFGTFGDPQVNEDMIRQGYEGQIVIPFLSAAEQYAIPPEARQVLTRKANNVKYLIQSVDAKDPVTFTFLLVDREP